MWKQNTYEGGFGIILEQLFIPVHLSWVPDAVRSTVKVILNSVLTSVLNDVNETETVRLKKTAVIVQMILPLASVGNGFSA